MTTEIPVMYGSEEVKWLIYSLVYIILPPTCIENDTMNIQSGDHHLEWSNKDL